MEVNFPKFEEEILEYWKKQKAFEKSVALRRAQGKRARRFVFYEGPPTANGKPGIHHVLSRSFKDIICRYKTMQGFLVERKAGWDTHGLAVEIETEKKLGLKSKKDVEQYGIEKFNAECKKSVWEYKRDWENLTERMGFWIDLENPYITYETPYIETLWRIIQTFWQKGLLYKGYKVVPYCSRCGTSLSSHELAQGYKTVKDPSVFVKFKIQSQKLKVTLPPNTYFLAWTTTPWTLPGNVALAVASKVIYVLAKKNNEHYVLAKSLAQTILGEHEEIEQFLGKDLIGLKYEPLFRFKEPEQGKKIWEVVPADFVSTEDGTGIVHTAVAYGAEDFELGKKENLAMLHLVNEEGRFNNEVTPWKGMFVKDADPLIIENLKERGLLFKEELYEHEYPFCWRCSTPLLYYAKDSWFVNMQKVKQELIANNKKINWVPAHLKEGRMGEWLKEVKDWAFSRERYWGTPLPIWECKKCEHREVIGSLEELQEKTRSHNTYYILRHGHSERQIKDVMSSWPEQKVLPLTKRGIKDIQQKAKALKEKKIDIIISSDLLRTRQTAEIVGKELGTVPLFDEKLRDVNVGPELSGKHIKELGKVWGKKGETSFDHYMRRFVEPLPGGESWNGVQERMRELMRDLEKKYRSKTVLLISHELPLTMLEGLAEGRSKKDIVEKRMKNVIDTGEFRNLLYSFLPLNEDMELDLHRPHIDIVQFSCVSCTQGTMQRVKEVVDVWFDSGSMPLAQGHWMGGTPPKLFPADYIVEGIDQTRGWFYTLLAVSTLLGFGPPYKNVISTGHVLDEKGEKMSKSKGNAVNPWDMINKYGIDAVRWYFFTMNNPGDPKLFTEKDIQQATRSFLLTFWNCFVFYETYAGKKSEIHPIIRRGAQSDDWAKAKNVLDKWILSRLSGITKEITAKLETYDVTGAGRTLENFVVNDLSLWHIRRSRSRFQNPKSKRELAQASKALGFVLSEVCKLAAPFLPFLSEHIFKELGRKGSVHWEDFPQPEKKLQATKLEQEMAWVRGIVAKALAERAKVGMKVRQPLAKLKVKSEKLKIASELLELLKDELNVKEVVFDKNLQSEVELDTTLTPELKEEGLLREIMRSIQGMRKEAGYKPQDKVALWYSGDQELCTLIAKNASPFKKSVGAKTLEPRTPSTIRQAHGVDREKEIEIESKSLWLGVKKI